MQKAIRILNLVLVAFVFLIALAICAQATELKTGVGIVNVSSGLRLREKPDSNAEIISTASYGDTAVVIRESNGWYLVDYNLDIGYMSAEYLDFKTAENVELGDGEINSASVNVRSKPSSDSESLVQLSEGDRARIIGINNGWYKIVYGSTTGYVRSDLMNLTEPPRSNSSGFASNQTIANELIEYAQDYLGTSYVWGGTSPSTGFDCSGYTKYVYSNFGYSLNRTAAQQLGNGTSISKSELQVGDLVFFGNTYSSSAAATHVGIYVGDNQFIHSASGGVKITSLSDDYYAPRYVGARRVL